MTIIGRSTLSRAGIAIGLALFVLGLFIIAVGWEEVLSAAARASLPIYAIAFCAMLVTLLSRSVVWHLLLGIVDKRRPFWLVGGVFLTAMFAKYVTPYGQVASGVGIAAVVSRYYESAYEESLAGIISADFLNYIPYYTYGIIGLTYVLFVESPSFDVIEYLLTGIGVIFILIVLIILLWRFRQLVKPPIFRVLDGTYVLISRIAPSYAKYFERQAILGRLEGFYLTVALLSRDRQTILLASLFGHIGWLGLAGALYFSALAVGVTLPIGVVFLSVAMSKFGFISPTPGGLGGVEIALAGVLFLLSPMSVALATAVAILYRFATYWFTILLGGFTSIALTVVDPTPP